MKTFKEYLESVGLKVWLDDLRQMPSNFDRWAKTAQEAINMLKTNNVAFISLDHDLGEHAGTGADVARWIEEHAFKYKNGDPDGLAPLQWAIHSANPVGRQNMLMALNNANRFWHDS